MNKTEIRQTLRILKKAQKLLTPETWIKRAMLRKHRADDCLVPANVDDAECWCLLGSLDVASHRLKMNDRAQVMRAVSSIDDTVYRRTLNTDKGFTTTAGFNDDRDTTLDDVLAVVRTTIKRLQRNLVMGF